MPSPSWSAGEEEDELTGPPAEEQVTEGRYSLRQCAREKTNRVPDQCTREQQQASRVPDQCTTREQGTPNLHTESTGGHSNKAVASKKRRRSERLMSTPLVAGVKAEPKRLSVAIDHSTISVNSDQEEEEIVSKEKVVDTTKCAKVSVCS